MSLIKNAVFKLVQVPIDAGTSNPTSTWVDTENFEGCLFLGNLATQTGGATATMAVQTASSTTASGVAITGATVSSTANVDDKLLAVDVYKPVKRFLRTLLTRATSNVEWGGTVAILYGPRTVPTTNSTTDTYAAAPVLSVSASTS